MRWLRRLCLLCFCILLVVVAIAIVDIIMLNITSRFAGCQFHPEIRPGFGCHGPWAWVLEPILNLPLAFIYAPLLNVVLVLGLAYPILALLERQRAKRPRGG